MKKPSKKGLIQTPKTGSLKKSVPLPSPPKGLKTNHQKFFLPFPYRKRLPSKKGAPKIAWLFRKNSGSPLKKNPLVFI
jgi:hypothetical protein